MPKKHCNVLGNEGRVETYLAETTYLYLQCGDIISVNIVNTPY